MRSEVGGRRPEAGGCAFSLVEMLAAIALLGLLLSLIVPMFNRVKHQARAQQCTANLRQIGVAISSYLNDHAMRFPVLAAGRDSREDADVPVLETVFLEYVNNEKVFHCTSDNKFFEKSGSSYFWNVTVNGQRFGDMNMLGLVKNEGGIPLVSDKENFHHYIGSEVNILYADGHILRELQFHVELDKD